MTCSLGQNKEPARSGEVDSESSEYTVHHSAECHFWLEHGQKTLFAIVRTVCDSSEDMAPTQASGSYDR